MLKRILETKPQKLFLAQDGARKGNHTDIEKVEICRETVENLVRTINRVMIIYIFQRVVEKRMNKESDLFSQWGIYDEY